MARTKNSLSSVYDERREDGAKLQKTFFLPLDAVECNWEDNIRPINEDHIKSWLHTMNTGGYVPPILVEMIDGTPFVVEGFHRHQAKHRHVAQGGDNLIECKEWRGTDLERYITMRDSTHGLPLTFLQDAELIAQMKGLEEDTTIEALAQRLGLSRTAVSNKLNIAACPDELKKMIEDDVVSATTVIDVINEVGVDNALDKVKFLLDKANAKGKARVTSRTGGTKNFSAAKMRNVLELLHIGLDYAKFSENYDKVKDGEVKVELKLTKSEMFDVVSILEEFAEHHGLND